MPQLPEASRSQLEEGERPSDPLQNLKAWLTDKGVPGEHASLTSELIRGFYSRHSLPTVGDAAHIGFVGKPTEFGGLYLWVYNLWATQRDGADIEEGPTIEEMEEMNAFTIPFSKEISQPLRSCFPHPSVRPKFLFFSDPAAIDSFEDVLRKGCKKARIEYLGVYRIVDNN